MYDTYKENGIIPDGQGYGIRKKYNFAKLTDKDLHEIITNIASDYGGTETSIQHRLQEFGITPEQLPGIDITAAIQRGIRDYVEMDAETGELGEQAIPNGSSTDSRKNQGLLSDTPRTNEISQEFKTKWGELYGFVDSRGDIYLDETVITVEHPIHEYTHLWDRFVSIGIQNCNMLIYYKKEKPCCLTSHLT